VTTDVVALLLAAAGAFVLAFVVAGPVARRGDSPFLVLQAGVVGAIAAGPILGRMVDQQGITATIVAGIVGVFAAWCAGVLLGYRAARRG